MAKGIHKPTPGSEEAKQDGRATRDRYGTEFYKAIGRRGGETTKTKRGSEHYRTSGTTGPWSACQPRISAPKHAAPRVERVGEDGLLLLVEDREAAALHCSGPHQPTPG